MTPKEHGLSIAATQQDHMIFDTVLPAPFHLRLWYDILVWHARTPCSVAPKP